MATLPLQVAAGTALRIVKLGGAFVYSITLVNDQATNTTFHLYDQSDDTSPGNRIASIEVTLDSTIALHFPFESPLTFEQGIVVGASAAMKAIFVLEE